MLIDIKNRSADAEIQELFGLCVFPDPEFLNEAVRLYQTAPDMHLYGMLSEQEVVGIIGYRHIEERTVEIRHLAVR